METIKRTIVTYWDSGMSVDKICRTFPYKHGFTKSIIKKMRENGELQPRKVGEITNEKVVALYNSGVTNPYEIAGHFGLKPSTVNSILVKAKLGRDRPKHNYKAKTPRKEEQLCENTRNIIRELRAGLKAREVARKLDMSRQWVYIIKAKYIDKGDNGGK